ncbi:hypothetical protein BESB_021490 [Besnoitia besnoiti]|uniref:Uncharacterized protein n=1 Tax=Besnoitia besnoiti TaxID=94643 RepID=A0A2A9M0X9_BESBE|nr:hypothetical protein BESB_021490 [Besnoitia besnoiti]PFH32208.1 hypothetical protein BESB_021490 [Besnoitia besnoiti]
MPDGCVREKGAMRPGDAHSSSSGDSCSSPASCASSYSAAPAASAAALLRPLAGESVPSSRVAAAHVEKLLRGISLCAVFQVSLLRAPAWLTNEQALLRRLLYKFKRQHRRADFFQKAQGVSRAVPPLLALALPLASLSATAPAASASSASGLDVLIAADAFFDVAARKADSWRAALRRRALASDDSGACEARRCDAATGARARDLEVSASLVFFSLYAQELLARALRLQEAAVHATSAAVQQIHLGFHLNFVLPLVSIFARVLSVVSALVSAAEVHLKQTPQLLRPDLSFAQLPARQPVPQVGAARLMPLEGRRASGAVDEHEGLRTVPTAAAAEATRSEVLQAKKDARASVGSQSAEQAAARGCGGEPSEPTAAPEQTRKAEGEAISAAQVCAGETAAAPEEDRGRQRGADAEGEVDEEGSSAPRRQNDAERERGDSEATRAGADGEVQAGDTSADFPRDEDDEETAEDRVRETDDDEAEGAAAAHQKSEAAPELKEGATSCREESDGEKAVAADEDNVGDERLDSGLDGEEVAADPRRLSAEREEEPFERVATTQKTGEVKKDLRARTECERDEECLSFLLPGKSKNAKKKSARTAVDRTESLLAFLLSEKPRKKKRSLLQSGSQVEAPAFPAVAAKKGGEACLRKKKRKTRVTVDSGEAGETTTLVREANIATRASPPLSDSKASLREIESMFEAVEGRARVGGASVVSGTQTVPAEKDVEKTRLLRQAAIELARRHATSKGNPSDSGVGRQKPKTAIQGAAVSARPPGAWLSAGGAGGATKTKQTRSTAFDLGAEDARPKSAGPVAPGSKGPKKKRKRPGQSGKMLFDAAEPSMQNVAAPLLLGGETATAAGQREISSIFQEVEAKLRAPPLPHGEGNGPRPTDHASRHQPLQLSKKQKKLLKMSQAISTGMTSIALPSGGCSDEGRQRPGAEGTALPASKGSATLTEPRQVCADHRKQNTMSALLPPSSEANAQQGGRHVDVDAALSDRKKQKKLKKAFLVAGAADKWFTGNGKQREVPKRTVHQEMSEGSAVRVDKSMFPVRGTSAAGGAVCTPLRLGEPAQSKKENKKRPRPPTDC